LGNFEADKLVDLKALELSQARYKALSDRFERETTQMRKELENRDEVIKDYEAAQNRNQEAMATFQANFVVV
jgi:hypothetical protein